MTTMSQTRRALVDAAQRHYQDPLGDALGSRPAPVRVLRWAAVGVAAVAAAVTLLVVGTTGNGPTNAFAGWSADPTTPATGQLPATEVLCRADDPALASLTPTVADTRGPFSMLLYVDGGATTTCTDGMPGGLIIGSTGSSTASLPSVAQGAIAVGLSGVREADGQAFSDLAGQVGAGVTGVTLVLDDGTNIEATTANGWFIAWWPGTQGVQYAAIATASGTSTQQLNLHSFAPPYTPTLPGGSSATGSAGA